MDPKDLPIQATSYSIFINMEAFANAQRVGALLAKSTLVPDAFRGKLENCVIAIELAERVKMSPLMVMQHLAVVNGKPGWDAQFVIAKINSCGRYEPLRFVLEGEGDDQGCHAWTREIGSSEKLTGPRVTWKMVRAEGWDTKSGSKWKTMPDVMFSYRAASFWGKRYCPELLLGMPSADELEDFTNGPRIKDMGNAEVVRDPETDLNAMLDQARATNTPSDARSAATDIASAPGATKPADVVPNSPGEFEGHLFA